ncbi:MAG TPA: quinone-dependent dihydroorotate dehydrogenase [Polyangiales bacterium]|nr:quinone-dependent dihydroorotate dehydrogenase [Polyangiales bacterium]
MLYRALVRPLLFMLPAEPAHRLGMAVLRVLSGSRLGLGLLRALFGTPDPILRTQVLGLTLPSPIGLAAGLDKDAEAHAAFAALGFGFVEVGTLTAEPQAGNPAPRMFRLPVDRALVNRMGFNNHGASDAAQRLACGGLRAPVLGINIGKSKVAPPERAVEDYVRSARLLGPHADYLVINVSSPNTPGLRDLQAVETLRPLLVAVRAELDAAVSDRRVPLLVKIAPDLADADVEAVADLALELGLDGIVAVNTTIGRDGLHSAPADIAACGAGGLSGAPLQARALAVLRLLRARVGERIALVSVGGVRDADDVWARLQAGAALVQLYSELIFAGPGLPSQLNRKLADRLRGLGPKR